MVAIHSILSGGRYHEINIEMPIINMQIWHFRVLFLVTLGSIITKQIRIKMTDKAADGTDDDAI